MNASNSPDLALPKPEPRTRTKGRKKRTEAAVKRAVRKAVVERDNFCRILGWDACEGYSEWAHMHSARRSKTRNQAATVRHSTMRSLELCTRHHRLYDAKELTIEALTDQGADGQLKFSFRGRSYSE